MNKKLKFIIAGVAIVAGLASAVSCQDLSKDVDSLSKRVSTLESTVAALQSKIDAGAVITNVTSTASGVKVTLSNGNTFDITNGKDGANGTNGTNGTNGKDGKDGAPGSVVTIGDNGNWFIDGVDTSLAAKGQDGAPGAAGEAGKDGVPADYYVPNPETGCFDKYSWDAETGAYVATPTEISYLAPGALTAIYDPETGVLTLVGVEGAEGGVVVIGGGATGAEGVTSVELLDYWAYESFTEVTEAVTSTFGPVGDQIEFKAGTEVVRGATYIVRVAPASAKITKEDISLINSKGDTYDKFVIDVKPFDGVITKATDFALWQVDVTLSEYIKDEFEKVCGKPGAQTAFAMKIGEAVTDYDLMYEHTDFSAKKANYYAADATVSALNVTDAGDVVWDINDLGNRNYEKDYKWNKNTKKNPTPAVKAVTKDEDKDNFNIDIDNRIAKPMLVAALNKPIAITWNPNHYKAVYAEIDFAQSDPLDPSELAAWKSYEPKIEGLNKLATNGRLDIVVTDPAAEDDIIAFRVYAVNWNGVLADPDGIAFDAIFGDEPEAEEWTSPAVATIVPAYAESYGTTDDLSEFVAWSGKKLTGANYATLTMSNDNLSDVEFGLYIAYKNAAGKTAYAPFIGMTAFTDWDKVIGIAAFTVDNGDPTVDAYKYWADKEEYTGTVTIYNQYDFELASFNVAAKKVLPTAAPEGLTVTKKDGILDNNTITVYADDLTGVVNTAYTAFSGAKWIARTTWYNDIVAEAAAATINADKKAFYDALGTLNNTLDISKIIKVEIADADEDGVDDFSNTNVKISVPDADYAAATTTPFAVSTKAVERTAATMATPIDVKAALVNGSARKVSVYYDYGIISGAYDIETEVVKPASKPTTATVTDFNFVLTTKALAHSYDWYWNVAEMSNAVVTNPPFSTTKWNSSSLNWMTNYPSLNANWWYTDYAFAGTYAGILKDITPFTPTASGTPATYNYGACDWAVNTAPALDWSAMPATQDILLSHVLGTSKDAKIADWALATDTTTPVYLPKTSEAKVLALDDKAVAYKWNKEDFFTVVEKETTPGNHDWNTVTFTKQDSYAPSVDVKGTLTFTVYDFLYNPINVSLDIVISD